MDDLINIRDLLCMTVINSSIAVCVFKLFSVRPFVQLDG